MVGGRDQGPRLRTAIQEMMRMTRTLGYMLAGTLTAATVAIGAAPAGEWATKDEAQAIVKKAVAFIKEQGPEKAYPEITNRSGRFIDRDLYVVVYGLDG